MPWEAQPIVEPVSSATIEQIGNSATFNVISGCVLTYDATDMTVDLGVGEITHNGSSVAVTAAANGYTLVADPTNPRWIWLAVDNTGTAAQVNGDPAVAPMVPALGDNVGIALVYVQAGLTIADSASYKLDKRVPAVPVPAVLVPGYTLAGSNTTEQTTTSTSAVDLVTISGLSIPATSPVMIIGNWRKSAGAAAAVGFGLKVNATVIGEASTSSAIVVNTNSTNQAQNGGFVVYLMPRRTDYQGGAFGYFNPRKGGTTTGNTPANDADIPTDTITSIAIRAISGSASVTAAVTDVAVYEMDI